MKDKLKNILSSASIDNIYLAGFIDIEGDTAEFYPDMRFIYFLFGDKVVEFQSIEQYSKLKIMILNEIAYKFEIDEDMIFSKSSVDEIILVDTLIDNSVRKISIFNLDTIDDNYIVCDSINIELTSGQNIFIDPSFHYGLGVGGSMQKTCWEKNLKDKSIHTEEIIIE